MASVLQMMKRLQSVHQDILGWFIFEKSQLNLDGLQWAIHDNALQALHCRLIKWFVPVTKNIAAHKYILHKSSQDDSLRRKHAKWQGEELLDFHPQRVGCKGWWQLISFLEPTIVEPIARYHLVKASLVHVEKRLEYISVLFSRWPLAEQHFRPSPLRRCGLLSTPRRRRVSQCKQREASRGQIWVNGRTIEEIPIGEMQVNAWNTVNSQSCEYRPMYPGLTLYR